MFFVVGLEFILVDHTDRLKPENSKMESCTQDRDCLPTMGVISENVAQYYGVTWEEQDQVVVVSHQRAATAATAAGKFKDEIFPVSTKIVDDEPKQLKFFQDCFAGVFSERDNAVKEKVELMPHELNNSRKKIGELTVQLHEEKGLAASFQEKLEKHFVDGSTIDGINENDTIIGCAGLKNIHRPAYLDLIKKGITAIMILFSSWNGVKMHANYKLIIGYLKNTLKFEGFVISDMIMISGAYLEFIDDLYVKYES